MIISEQDERWIEVISVVERYTKRTLEDDERDELRAAIGGAAAAYLWSIDQAWATLAEQAKAMERIQKAAREIQVALSSLGSNAHHVALGLITDRELDYEERECQTDNFCEAISRIAANAPEHISFIKSRTLRGAPSQSNRSAFWMSMCGLWADWYGGSVLPATSNGEPGGPAYKFIAAASRMVMGEDDCTAGKIHEFLKSHRDSFVGVLAE